MTHGPLVFATATAPPPATPERALLVAIVAVALEDSRRPCAPPRQGRCLRADAIAAAGERHLRDLAGGDGVRHREE